MLVVKGKVSADYFAERYFGKDGGGVNVDQQGPGARHLLRPVLLPQLDGEAQEEDRARLQDQEGRHGMGGGLPAPYGGNAGHDA